MHLVRAPQPEFDLSALLKEFEDFGEFTGLCLNLEETRILLEGLDRARVGGIKVAAHVRYLGAQVGHVSAAVAYARSFPAFQAQCTMISCMLLSRQQKVLLIHTWCFPVLQVTSVAHYAPDLVLKRLRRTLVVAFHAQSRKVPLNVLISVRRREGSVCGCRRSICGPRTQPRLQGTYSNRRGMGRTHMSPFPPSFGPKAPICKNTVFSPRMPPHLPVYPTRLPVDQRNCGLWSVDTVCPM